MSRVKTRVDTQRDHRIEEALARVLLDKTKTVVLNVNLPVKTHVKGFTVELPAEGIKLYYVGTPSLQLPTDAVILSYAEAVAMPASRFRKSVLAVDRSYGVEFIKDRTKAIRKLYTKPLIVLSTTNKADIDKLRDFTKVKITAKKTFSINLGKNVPLDKVKSAILQLETTLQQQSIDMRQSVLYLTSTHTPAYRL